MDAPSGAWIPGGPSKTVVLFNQLFSFQLSDDINKESYDSNQHCYGCCVHIASKHILSQFFNRRGAREYCNWGAKDEENSFRIGRGCFTWTSMTIGIQTDQNMQSQMFQKFEDFFYGFWILNQTQIKWFVQNQTWVGIFSSNRVMIYKRW